MSLLMISALIIIIASPWKYDQIVAEKYESPSLQHWFGTDYLGRDIMIRLCIALFASIGMAFGVILIGGFLGSLYGIIAGYFGGTTERILVTIIDILKCIPEILIAIFLMVITNAMNFNNSASSIIGLIITLSIITCPLMARVAKNETKIVRQMEFIAYAKIKGANSFHIIFFHVVPNIKNKLISVMAQRIPKIILIESFLSYIGIGVQPPFPSLGKMINDGISVIRIAPHVLLFPTLVVALIVLLFNLFCESAR